MSDSLAIGGHFPRAEGGRQIGPFARHDDAANGIATHFNGVFEALDGRNQRLAVDPSCTVAESEATGRQGKGDGPPSVPDE